MDLPSKKTITAHVRARTSCERPSRHPYLFHVLSCDRPLEPSARYSLAELDQVVIGRGAGRPVRQIEEGQRTLRIELGDGWISSRHAELKLVLGRWVAEDLSSRNGTLVNGTRVSRSVLSDGDLIELGHGFFIYRDTVPQAGKSASLEAPEPSAPAFGLTTLLPPLERQFSALAQIARSQVTVLLEGESGTGKEVMAKAIHELSGRTGAFVPVNCGALPETLVETELFGYRKGAFSGALEDRAGLVRGADRGTLFLDEISDLPMPSQAAFLRVLQERQVMPVGATRPAAVEVRFCSATHRQLDLLVQKGAFREDLFARIAGFTARLPPLRQRREDMGILMAAILKRVAPARAAQIAFQPKAARAILTYDWPLNIRELEKCLEAAVVLAGNGTIELKHLAEHMREPRRPGADSDDIASASFNSLRDHGRRAELTSLLSRYQGNISAVSRAMGKAHVQIRRWLKRYDLDATKFRPLRPRR